MPGSSNVSVGISLTNFTLIVTYESGPVTYILTPAGGPIEKGQSITVTGPGAGIIKDSGGGSGNTEGLTYAALQGDKVIPITPKVISDDEVILEIPIPASDPCFDCFPDCPDCDACVDDCNEDLAGDKCIECMAECLECLANCLEDLQLAEECQQSTGNPEETPTEIIIIVSGGTQFSGSVVLGNFTVLVANGSGIYRFVEGKTNDTLYTATRDGTTYDVKIPNPGGRTGFFRS